MMDIAKIKQQEKRQRLFDKIKPFGYLAPFAIGVTIFTLYPIVNVFMIAFQENYNYITKTHDSIGFDNFAYIFSAQPSAISRIIIAVKPSSTPTVAILVCFPLCEEGMSSSTTT